MEKRMTKILNTVSVLALVAALLVSFTVFFGTPAQAWDGTTSTSFSSGSGTETNPYVIKTANQFGYFIKQLNSGVTYEGLHIRLGANLNMTGSPWVYEITATFAGTLDGQCYTVTTDCPLLPDIAATGTVRKMNVTASQFVGQSVLCMINNGMIEACCVRGNVPETGSSTYSAGFICDANYGTVRFCGAVGKASACGDGDSDAYAGMVAMNKGTVNGCFSAMTVSASASGKYNDPYYHPLSNGQWGTGTNTVTNSYYDSTLYTRTSSVGSGISTEEMKSASFLTMIAGNTVPGAQWVAGSDGYPTLASCGLGTVSISGWEGKSVVTYHTSNQNITLTRGGVSSGTMYYTTDGTDPKTSSTRKSTSSSTASFPISGDKTISAVVYSGSQYGTVMKIDCVYMPGSGTAANPYKISTKKGLDAVRLDTEASYKLTTSLIYTDADYAFGGVASGGWNPIPSFSGTFDGGGYTITGLRGNKGGLFATNSGTVSDLLVTEHRLFCGDETGPIANRNTGTITRCFARSAFTLSSLPSAVKTTFWSYAGGIVGYNSGTVSYCSTEGIVAGRQVTREGDHYIGGIVGAGGDVNNCMSTALLVSDDTGSEVVDFIYMGGISGGQSSIYDCRADCEFYIDSRINYDAYVGPICGHFTNGFAMYCVAPPCQVDQGFDAYIRLFTANYAPNSNYCYRPTAGTLPEDFSELDFETKWMMTAEGVRPRGVMDANGHCFDVTNYKPVTCYEAGSFTMKCQLCTSTKTHTMASPGHATVTDAAVETSCSATGLTEGSHCRRCNLVFVAQQEIPKLLHTYSSGTCTVCKQKEAFLANGQCGTSVNWKLNDAGKLTITGSGDMYDTYNEGTAPWSGYADSILEVVVGAGITSVGRCAFDNLSNLTTVTLPNSLTRIGLYAFEGCASLTTLKIPANVNSLGTSAFADTGLTSVQFLGNAPSMGQSVFRNVTATVSYPSAYSSWNTVTGNDYGGRLTWQSYELDLKLNTKVDTVGDESFGAQITAPEGGWKAGINTFRVSCEKACFVLVSYDGGSTYTRLTATADGDGYSFTVTEMDAKTVVAVALAGDANGDGKISAADVTRLRAALLGKINLDAVGELTGDANGNGSLTAADATKLQAVALGKTKLAW